MTDRIRQIFSNFSLRTKLSLLVFFTLLTTLIASQWFLYRYIAEDLEHNLRTTADSTLTQVQTSMENELRSLTEHLLFIQVEPAFEDALTDYLLDTSPETSRGVAQSRLSPCLSLHRASEPLINSLLLYTSRGAFTDLGLLIETGYDVHSSPLVYAAQHDSRTLHWLPPQRDEFFITHQNVVPLLYQFRIEGFSDPCILIANIDQDALTKTLAATLPNEASGLLIVDENGTPITNAIGSATLFLEHPEQLATLMQSEEEHLRIKHEGQSYLIAQRPLYINGWNLVYLHSEAGYYQTLFKIQRLFCCMLLVVLGIMLAALVKITRSVTGPLLQLSECMHQAELQTEPKPFVYPYSNEVGRLASSYNSLLAHNTKLLSDQEHYIEQLQYEKEQLRIEQQLKRRAELKALQAQINPHFLYNTLDSIHWKAEIAAVPDISQMTLALATLFRIGLSRGQEIIPLEQELRYVDSYLQIQKFRYGDRLNYRLDLPKELLSLYSIKLILQPLVENAIYHGIKEKDEPGLITVTGHRDGDTLVLQVIDDGLGIPPPRLKMLQDDLKRGLIVSNDGYGIFNVNERIRLYFGPDYGLTLDSVFEKGTVATIRLPCVDKKEAERYVSLTDS